MSNKDNCVKYEKTHNNEICGVYLADIVVKLKDNTEKLLSFLDNIHSKNLMKNYRLSEFVKTNVVHAQTITDLIEASSIERPDMIQTNNLKAIYGEDEHNCSIYRRLTRKCICLNQPEYNDFVIHFNEDTDYFTSNIGEIIKNMRILKKFLYMGGPYTKHALMFLNEGLLNSSPNEKIEIAQACSYADICNVFEDSSIVIFCLFLPCKYEHYGDISTQYLAASILNKLASLEEGLNYIKFNSKITKDIKKLVIKKNGEFDNETLGILNATLKLMQPTINNDCYNYYCKPYTEDDRKISKCYESPYKYEKIKRNSFIIKLSKACMTSTKRSKIIPMYTD